MANFGERLQRSAVAAYAAWNGTTNYTQPQANHGMWQGLSAQDAERFAKYKVLWKYYSGEHKRALKQRTLNGTPGPDGNVTINLSRRVVNKGAAFLFGEPLGWDVKGANTGPAKETLNAIWRSDEWKMAFLNELAINGGVYGDIYVQVVPATTPLSMPRIINLDPCIVVPHYSADDIDEVYEYELRWRAQGTLKRTRYVWADDGLSWDIVSEILANGKWVADPHVPPEVWEYSWCPIIHGKNLPNPNNFFGTSDLEDADLNDAINGTVSNLNRIVRIFAHPVIWGKMFSKGDLDVSKVSLATDKDAHLSALELARDVSGAQGFADFLSTEFSEVTQVPGNDPETLRAGAQSGFALRVLFHELVQKTGVKRALYGRVIAEASQRALELAGKGADNVISLSWRSPLPTDMHEQTESDRFDIDNGLVSRQTLAARRGYDWEQEKARLSEEASLSTKTNAGFANLVP